MNSSTVWIFSDTSTSTTNQNKLRFKKKSRSSSTLNYSTIILIPCALSTTTMPTYFFFSFGVLFKCIPWHTAKILFESLVHCEYKNTKPNIEIKQIKKKNFDFPFSSKIFSNMWKKLGKTTSKTNFLSHSWMLASDFLWEWDQSYIRLPRMKGSPQSTLAILWATSWNWFSFYLLDFPVLPSLTPCQCVSDFNKCIQIRIQQFIFSVQWFRGAW